MTKKINILPDSPDNLEEMKDAVTPILADQATYLEEHGIDRHVILEIVLSNNNLMKWWAVNYHRLMLAGKVPEDMQYRVGTELTKDISRTQIHRELDKFMDKEEDDE